MLLSYKKFGRKLQRIIFFGHKFTGFFWEVTFKVAEAFPVSPRW
jgi:hypothetical protein